MPQFVEPQLARLVSGPPSGAGWAHEVKFDGYRMQLRVDGGKARFFTRKGLDWSGRFPEIVRDGAGLPNCMIDGEACALKDGIPDFGALQVALSEGKTDGIIFYVFDLLFLDGHDLRNQPLRSRKDVLKKLLKSARVPARIHYVEHFAQSGKEMLRSACSMGLEGIISKRIEAPYSSGRSDLWLKSKCRGGQEIVIGGWWGDANKLRSLLAGVYDGGKFTYVGNVGTGFNSANVPPLLRALRPLRRPTTPFEAGPKPPRPKEVNWVEPRLVAEIEFAGFTHDGNIRQAAFKGLREDKSDKSVVRERAASPPSEAKVREKEAEVRKKKPSVITVKSVTSKEDAVVGGITITHASKPIWPAEGKSSPITKLDLANYLEAVADMMLPHIAGRPISIVRAPDGINGQIFFQRHMLPGMKHTRPIRTVGEPKPYIMVEDLKGLMELAQFAVTEIHPWGVKPHEPGTPEILIFDLDPEEGLPFARVIDAAKEMRERVEAVGLEAFIKTTGGKGLHVVTPIKGGKDKLTWPDAKEFARVLCEKMAADARDRYTTNMSKKLRRGRIFLDYLRNDRTSTAVGPYSTRGRPGATIALPIKWSQVNSSLDPKDYSITTAKSFLRKSDPWKDIRKAAGLLSAARKKLDKM
jgi:bifunctional non-homologous end joining protein LigD